MYATGMIDVSSLGLGSGLPALFGSLAVVAVFWSIFWKGLALWHSARKGQQWWFMIFMVVNTLGVLEIVYLFGVAKLKISNLFSK